MVVTVAASLLLLFGCAPPEEPGSAGAAAFRELRGEAFGTTWRVKWRGPVPSEAEAQEAIVGDLEAIDRSMSSWRVDSEINQVRAAGQPHPVGEDTLAVVDAALDLARATGGAFDPTVEPLMELWGFRGARRAEAPSDDDLARVLATVGWHRVALGRSPQGVATIDAGGTALDLSAIAKGHAVDRVSLSLSALGATDHLVEIGGEVRGHGQGPAGPWRLGIDQPDGQRAPGEKFAALVAIRNTALATSGNYRNAYDASGDWVVHTMDPRTGRPHLSEVASATVIAPDCRTADGWATALMVLPPAEGIAAIEARPELDALLLLAGTDGFVEQRSSGMGRWLEGPR